MTRAAVYARVSTDQQTVDNQLLELRSCCQARGLLATEFVDAGVSGAKESRPALDALLRAAKRRKFDVLIVWKLDRLGRSLRHLIITLDELQSLGVGFVSVTEAVDTASVAGRFQLQILAAVAEFERGMIRERVVTGLARAKAQGVRLGRRRTSPRPRVRLAALPCGRRQSCGAARSPLPPDAYMRV
jgi:DNA invertase Pin-like site-specific DNA recombinase